MFNLFLKLSERGIFLSLTHVMLVMPFSVNRNLNKAVQFESFESTSTFNGLQFPREIHLDTMAASNVSTV